MAVVAQKLTGRGLAAGLAVLVLAVAGCTTTEPFLGCGAQPPPAPVYQVVATWRSEVAYAADPTHGGVPGPGLAGRLYLFGPQIDFPVVGDGSVVVDLYNESPGVGTGEPVMLEQWRIDRDTLKRLLRKDVIGWGYTLFLPWGTFKPEITQVRLRLRYDPAKGTPLFAESAPLTINAVKDYQVSSKSAPAAGVRPPAASLPPVPASVAAGPRPAP